jgi:hypothetical protein
VVLGRLLEPEAEPEPEFQLEPLEVLRRWRRTSVGRGGQMRWVPQGAAALQQGARAAPTEHATERAASEGVDELFVPHARKLLYDAHLACPLEPLHTTRRCRGWPAAAHELVLLRRAGMQHNSHGAAALALELNRTAQQFLQRGCQTPAAEEAIGTHKKQVLRLTRWAEAQATALHVLQGACVVSLRSPACPPASVQYTSDIVTSEIRCQRQTIDTCGSPPPLIAAASPLPRPMAEFDEDLRAERVFSYSAHEHNLRVAVANMLLLGWTDFEPEALDETSVHTLLVRSYTIIRHSTFGVPRFYLNQEVQIVWHSEYDVVAMIFRSQVSESMLKNNAQDTNGARLNCTGGAARTSTESKAEPWLSCGANGVQACRSTRA